MQGDITLNGHHTPVQFEVGKTYRTRSIVDYDTIFLFHIVARTAKTVTFTQHDGEPKKRGIYLYENVEQFKPFGTHSMCPIVSADEKSTSAGLDPSQVVPRLEPVFDLFWSARHLRESLSTNRESTHAARSAQLGQTMTDKLAAAILDALRDIAFNLGDEGSIVEQLSIIRELLEEMTATTNSGHRFLRTLDISRD